MRFGAHGDGTGYRRLTAAFRERAALASLASESVPAEPPVGAGA